MRKGTGMLLFLPIVQRQDRGPLLLLPRPLQEWRDAAFCRLTYLLKSLKTDNMQQSIYFGPMEYWMERNLEGHIAIVSTFGANQIRDKNQERNFVGCEGT